LEVDRTGGKTTMDNWKRAVVGISAGAAVLLVAKGKTTAGVVVAGVGLSMLASEYPDQFAEFRERLPEFVGRGSVFLDIVVRAGERLAEAETQVSRWYGTQLGT
jgi:hypothetical protein